MNAKAAEYIDTLLALPEKAILRALAEELVTARAQRTEPLGSPGAQERHEANVQVAASVLLSRAQVAIGAVSQPMSVLAFNEKKATQAAAALLNDLPGKQMDFYSFLKLLYIADRISLQETGALVTTDDMIAMDEGPLSDIVYNCIKGEAARCVFWQEHIHKEPEGCALSVKRDPGDSELCDYEVELLHRVAVEHGNKTWRELRRLTHEFAEYKENYVEGTSRPLPLRDLLVAVGRGEQADRIIAETQDRAALSRLFGGHNRRRGMSKRFQFVWRWHPRDWGFVFVRPDRAKTDWALIFRWMLLIGPLEIRRWAEVAKKEERPRKNCVTIEELPERAGSARNKENRNDPDRK